RSLQRSLPEPESSLAAGIAFGRDDGLSDEAKSDFNRAGLRHLVAVSGSNVTLVAALMYFLAIPVVGRRWAWIPAALSLAAYLGAAGLAPSVLRSGLMAGIFLAGSVVGRPQSGLPALFAAIIGMTAFHPSLAVDAGFLLSATATAGIIAFSPRVFAAVQFVTARGRLPAPIWVCQAIALTFSATVSTLPIMWVTFGRISLVSPLANLVVEPFFVLAFWASVAAAVLGMISQPLGAVAGIVAFYPLHFIVWSARTFAGLPGASLDAPAGSATAGVVTLAVLTGFALLAYRYPARTSEESATIRNRRKSGNRFVIGAAAATSLFLVLPAAWAAHEGPSGFSVRFFDVGQGDGALVTTPHGKQIVIDGGPSGLGIARNLSEAMPPWDRSIDLLILSHPQEDHMAGLVEVAERYRIGSVVDNGNANTTATFGYFASVLPSRRVFSQGDSIMIDGVRLDVLWPPASYVNAELNDTSLVIRVTYGQTSFLFTGDSEAPVHEALEASTDLSATVLKVPHHGSKTTDPALFPSVHPTLAVISVGTNNIFGHPHPDTLHALGAIPVFRTDERGTITVRSDGSTIRVSTER
ncbi:MAG: DNA internalization-related competence protein ComEC/Rec2, partial [bacterium]